jgi:hypothetical protein
MFKHEADGREEYSAYGADMDLLGLGAFRTALHCMNGRNRSCLDQKISAYCILLI